MGGGDVQRFRGGLVFKAHRLCASLNSRLESNNKEEEAFHLPEVIKKKGSTSCSEAFLMERCDTLSTRTLQWGYA